MFACIHIPKASDGVNTILVDCAGTFSPRVENSSAGTVVFDLEGLERLFGSYWEIATQVADRIRPLGLEANIAVASNPDAAICAARGFAGITVLTRGTEAARLRDLPLTALSPSPEILETLDRWGIRTLYAFAQLPARQIAERFGQDGVALHQLARGAGSRPLNPHADPLRFYEITELDYEIATIEPLTFILSRMLENICSRLRSRNLATHEVHLWLGTVERILNLPLPVRNPKLLTRLLILDLESHPPGAPVQRIRIETIPAKPRVTQNGLFVPRAPEPEKLELTLARLKAIVGEGNVGSAEVVDTHRPDAFRINRFKLNERGLKPATTYHAHVSLRLLRPALEATVQLRDGNPAWIGFHCLHGSIVTASGPWRTSGDWWRPHTWDREEWDIEVRDLLYRIYYDVHMGRWYVQGVYD